MEGITTQETARQQQRSYRKYQNFPKNISESTAKLPTELHSATSSQQGQATNNNENNKSTKNFSNDRRYEEAPPTI